jgi:hypothetical protein
MFRVFISSTSLGDLCLKEMCKEEKNKSEWFLILSKQNVIYLEKNIYDELDYNNPLFRFSESYQIEFKSSSIGCFDKKIEHPEMLLNEPQGVFLLDIEEEEARDIQEKYGIVCKSVKSLEECSITSRECSFSLFKGKSRHSWSKLFEEGVKAPSNALIIQDRYIFGYDSANRSGYKDGVENIKQIMKAVLPEELYCAYHVLILYDKSNSSDKFFSVENVAEELENFKNEELNKPYEVIIELYSISHTNAYWRVTHNRKILSNYFIGSAEHSIKAFSKEDGSATCLQQINVESSYSKGLNENSDSASVMLDYLLDVYNKTYLEEKRKFELGESGIVEYIRCDNADAKINDIQNRLLVFGAEEK